MYKTKSEINLNLHHFSSVGEQRTKYQIFSIKLSTKDETLWMLHNRSTVVGSSNKSLKSQKYHGLDAHDECMQTSDHTDLLVSFFISLTGQNGTAVLLRSCDTHPCIEEELGLYFSF